MKTLLLAYLLVLPILAEYVSEVEYTLENLGCWTDTGSRAIPNVFYGDAVDTIAKCKAAAIENGRFGKLF